MHAPPSAAISLSMRVSKLLDSANAEFHDIVKARTEIRNRQMPLPGFSKASSSSKEKAFAAPDFRSVQDAIVGLYQQKIKDLEESTLYHNFGSAPLSPGEVKARPMVLLIGQYSTGKTTFIRHLLGRDFPHMHIGPEPTTDGFMAIVKGHHEAPRSIPGNAATSDNNYPFQALSKFGAGFMNRFCVVPSR